MTKRVEEMTAEELLDEFGPDRITDYGKKLRAEILRRMEAGRKEQDALHENAELLRQRDEAINGKQEALTLAKDQILAAKEQGLVLVQVRGNEFEWYNKRAEDAEEELRQWHTWGVIEVAIRNPNVADYCKHWEGRAEAAEQQLRDKQHEVEIEKSQKKLLFEQLREKERELAAARSAAFRDAAQIARETAGKTVCGKPLGLQTQAACEGIAAELDRIAEGADHLTEPRNLISKDGQDGKCASKGEEKP